MMFTLSLVSQALLASATIWLLRHFLRIGLTKSDVSNVPGPKMSSFFGGNLNEYFAPDSWDWQAYNVKKFGRIMRLWGLFGIKQLWVSDPLALHYIYVKEAHLYDLPGWTLEARRILLGDGLLTVTGDRHKKQRKMMNPVFSIKHMKLITPLFHEIAHRIRDAITKKVADNPQELDMLLWVSQAALELIGIAGLGHSFETFDESTHPSAYTQAVKDFQPAMGKLAVHLRLLDFTRGFLTDWIKRKLVDLIPSKRLHHLAEITDVMYSTSCNVLDKKLQALDAGDDSTVQQIGEGKDIISILIRENKDAAPEDRLPDDEVLGQMSTLIFAAFDTTSSALARTIYLLSRHPDVQNKLRAEVTAALKNGDISYEDLVSLPYLEAICRETLRLYPPVPQLTRQTLEDTVLPLSTPIIGVDGREMSYIHIPKGTDIITGFMASNTDKLIWGDDAAGWKPDRWLKPLPDSVTAARVPGVYANMMTFSGGSRSCIGFKFSQLEMKVVLAVLLQSFSFEPIENKEIKFNMGSIVWPRVVGGSGKAELPIKVSLVKSL